MTVKKPGKLGPNKKPKRKGPKSNIQSIWIKRFDIFFEKLSNWQGGLAAAILISGWIVTHKSWLILLSPLVVFLIFRKLKISSKAQVLWSGIALGISIFCFIANHRRNSELSKADVSQAPKADKPQFIFSLSTAEAPQAKLELTNEFLIFKPFSTNDVMGGLIIPVSPGQSNISLRIRLFNKSTNTTAEIPLASLMIPKEWRCTPGQGWIWGEDNLIVRNSGLVKTNALQAWAIRLFSMLPGDGQILSDFTLETPNNPEGFLWLNAKSKDGTSLGIRSRLFFWTNNDPVWRLPSPIVVLGINNSSGTFTFKMPEDKLERR